MKLLIVCVNYNSYNTLNKYLLSLEKSCSVAKNCFLDVIVADNSTHKEHVYLMGYSHISIRIEEFDNLGYLGAAQAVVNKLSNIKTYDYVAITNVDILMEEQFLSNLSRLQLPSNVAWIAPSIYSLALKLDRNPSVTRRYTKTKLRLLKLTYNKYILGLYEKLYYKRKIKPIGKSPEMNIYAGHGSFILLTKEFFTHYETINYPMFLYGEELYFAELIYKAKLKVRYIPSLIIRDFEHVSTSTLHKDKYYKYNKEAIGFILKEFY